MQDRQLPTIGLKIDKDKLQNDIGTALLMTSLIYIAETDRKMLGALSAVMSMSTGIKFNSPTEYAVYVYINTSDMYIVKLGVRCKRYLSGDKGEFPTNPTDIAKYILDEPFLQRLKDA